MARNELRDERVYDHDRAEQLLWRLQHRHRLSRREVLKMLAAGGALAAAPAIVTGRPKAWAEHVPVVKPTPSDLFYDYGSNRETRFEAMAGRGYHTPNDLFFVRNHTRTPHLDAASWRLRIEGSGVRRAVELSYDDILAMGSQSETKFIECAGNARSQFREVQGRPTPGTQWRLGAIGVAEWTGVRLADLLDMAGVRRGAIDVMPEGLDSLRVRRPLPIEKALEDETLVVYGMNGQPLPPDHGFPARLLVPGWVGVANIKWVGRIEVSEQPLFSPWNTTTYVMIGDAYPDRPPVTTQQVKSAFELPWGGEVAQGHRLLTGRSWSAHSRIEKVEVSIDGGTTWQVATLGEANVPKAWVQWEMPWNARPGNYRLMTRATDGQGNRQPDTVPFNELGYLYLAVVEHPVTVV